MAQMGQQAQVAQDTTTAGIQRFQTNQDNLDELMKMRNDTSMPEHIRKRSGDRAYELMNQQYKQSQAQTKLDEMVQTGDQVGMAKVLSSKPKDEEGSFLKMLLLGFVSPQLAGAEAIKLGLGPTKWSQTTYTDKDGNQVPVEIKTRIDGKILGGSKLDGTPLTTEELNLAGGSLGNKDYDIVGGTFVSDTLKDKKGNALVGTVYRSKTNPNNQFVQTDEGRKPLAGFRPQSTSGSLEQQGTTQLQKLRNDLQFKGPEAAAKALGEFDAMNGTRYLDQYKQNAPQFFQSIGMAPPGQQAAGGAAPTQGASTTTTTPAPITTASPADITSGKKVTEAERIQFVEKVLPEINKKGDDGRFVADTRRTQMTMLTGPNSAIMGIYRGSGTEYEKARSVLRDAIAGTYSGKEGGERLSEAIRGITIPEEQMAALKLFAQMNTNINAKTLAENAGEGPKSDADVKMNQAANMTNIGDLPAYAALAGLSISQFAGDVNKRKQDFVLANRDKYQTQSQVEQAWSKEKDMLNRQYAGIYKERLNFIDAKMVEKFGKDWRKRPGDETQGFYRDASIHSFNVLPTPNYDVQTQKFVYPTQQSKVAAMRAVTGR
jgi:ribosomal protein S6E (S10)